jgi:hypothetical protein
LSNSERDCWKSMVKLHQPWNHVVVLHQWRAKLSVGMNDLQKCWYIAHQGPDHHIIKAFDLYIVVQHLISDRKPAIKGLLDENPLVIIPFSNFQPNTHKKCLLNLLQIMLRL